MTEPIRLGPTDALPIDLPGCHLVLERCIPHVLPDQGHAGFGTLAFAPDGRTWRDGDGRTRLYTTTHSASSRVAIGGALALGGSPPPSSNNPTLLLPPPPRVMLLPPYMLWRLLVRPPC